ncbi:MAG: hypothetical protein D6732_00185 [Methanobacteriota archaeon]|nr:MAG: hypothetical protein D6732_00185 [Euryarchaeota archaeon]
MKKEYHTFDRPYHLFGDKQSTYWAESYVVFLDGKLFCHTVYAAVVVDLKGEYEELNGHRIYVDNFKDIMYDGKNKEATFTFDTETSTVSKDDKTVSVHKLTEDEIKDVSKRLNVVADYINHAPNPVTNIGLDFNIVKARKFPYGKVKIKFLGKNRPVVMQGFVHENESFVVMPFYTGP